MLNISKYNLGKLYSISFHKKIITAINISNLQGIMEHISTSILSVHSKNALCLAIFLVSLLSEHVKSEYTILIKFD